MPSTTPIECFLSLLEEEFSCGRRSVATILLADREVKWGRRRRNARQIATGPGDKRQLTDYVSNSLPGTIPADALESLKVAIPELADHVMTHLRTADDAATSSSERYRTATSVFTETYAYPMTCALEDYGCAGDIFDNVLDSIRGLAFSSERHRLCAALALYASAAFLGDVERAANLTVQYSAREFHVDLLAEWDPEAAANEEGEPVELGVQRLIRGTIRGRRHTLAPEGTMFGSVPETDGDYVADVNNSVSYQHLVVRQEVDGRWVAEGLGSKWGTYIERPGVDDHIVVELPEDEREDELEPVEILPGDVLVLGSTRFEVQLFQRGA